MSSINKKKEVAGNLEHSPIAEWSPTDLYARKDSCEMIDVRSPEEFEGPLSHVMGSKLITLGAELDNFLQKKSQIPQENPIVFICRSGARSMKAALQARELGICQVVNLKGGMIDWNESKLPTQQNKSRRPNT